MTANSTNPLAALGGTPQSAAQMLVGPLIIGSFLNILFLGFLIMQTVTYYRIGKDDPKWMKILVAGLLVLEIFNSCIACVMGYTYAIIDFGIVQDIVGANYLFGLLIMTTAVSEFIVQAYFGLRVKWLTGKTWVTIVIFGLSLLTLGSAFAVAVEGAFIVKKFIEFRRFRWLIILWLASAPVTDVIISWSLVHYLQAKHTGFPATDDILDKITRSVIQTGVVTVIWAIVVLAVFTAVFEPLHFIFCITLAKIYANCMLSCLNARGTWNCDNNTPNSNVKQWSSGRTNTGLGTSSSQTGNSVIHVHRDRMQYSATESYTSMDIKRNVSLDIPPPLPRKATPIEPTNLEKGLAATEDEFLDYETEPRARNDRRVDWSGVL
ncbi:hypothetical protein DL93DRAFT_2167058 [Clavulina sp. PMI_390]|nr:hypothetical protein DL93DRAFT_2167058 [Clavulina sp. PMI_390]